MRPGSMPERFDLGKCAARLTRAARIVKTVRDAPPRAVEAPAPYAVAQEARACTPRAVAREPRPTVHRRGCCGRGGPGRAGHPAPPAERPGETPSARPQAPRAALARPRPRAPALDGVAARAALAAPRADPRVSRVRAAILPRAGGHQHPGRAGAEAWRAGLGLARSRAAWRVGATTAAPALHHRARVH